MEELMINIKDFQRLKKHFRHSQVWLGASAEGEEQRFALLMPLPIWSQAKDTQGSSVRGFYNAGLSSLVEAGSLNHHTKHLSSAAQLQACCSDTWEESTLRCRESCMCTSVYIVPGWLGSPRVFCSYYRFGIHGLPGRPGLHWKFPSGLIVPESWYTQNSISIVYAEFTCNFKNTFVYSEMLWDLQPYPNPTVRSSALAQ